MSRIRVAFHDPRLSAVAGGGEVLTLAMIEALDPSGFDCTVVTRDGGLSPLFASFCARRPDVHIVAVDGERAGLGPETSAFLRAHGGEALWGRDALVDDAIRFNSAARRLYLENHFDIVSVSVLVDVFGLPPGQRYLLHIGGSPPPELARIEAPLLERFIRMTAVSNFIAVDFCEAIGFPDAVRRIRVVPPSLGNEFEGPAKEYGNRDIDVLYAGRLTKRKGVDLILDAVPFMRASVGPLRVVVVGTGPEEKALRAKAEQLDGPSEVLFTGPLSRTELVGYLDRARCFAYPTRKPEAFGLAPLEAMARGAVPVVGQLGGMAEYVEPGENVFVLPSRVDPQTLGKSLTSALSDSERLARMAAAGRRTTSRFSISAFHEAVNRIFRECAVE